MAYAALVSLAHTIDLILNYHQDSISPQLKDEVGSIQKCVNNILEAFSEDIPEKANSLEGRIREAAHAAEDAIEFLLSKQIHEVVAALSKFEFASGCAVEPGSEHQTWEEYRRLRNDFYSLNKAAEELKSIAGEILEIKNGITDKNVPLGDSTAASSSSTVLPAHKEVMLGCDNDLMEMKSRLCGESSKLQVIPIVGMGGIGKTTLTRNVYDDPLSMEYFDIRVWVTVSQNYNVKDIISNLLVSMKGIESTNAHYVYQHLKSRRYLIVLDDVWSTEAWDDLQMMFPDDGNGSRIMITTRLSDVASYPDPYNPVHEMQLMDEDQSWNLLRHKVFKQDPCPVELEDVGNIIARSCRGLPLAIAVISGLLIVDQTKAAWENIAKDVKSAISSNDEQFDKILSLSYTRLPHHLRACFLYMGGFPEAYNMHVSKLIRLLVAEGFLKPNPYYKSYEETAEEYLEDLVKRSLVSVTERKSNGRIKIFGMHDLMREMCIKRAKEENFILHLRGFLGVGVNIPRRLCIFQDGLRILEYASGSNIRTIIRENRSSLFGSTWCLGEFRLLRILELSEAPSSFYSQRKDSPLPDEVYELLHLRYLALDSKIKVGSAISNLQNLQTLIIKDISSPDYDNFIELPVEIWMLRQLRHLIVSYADLPIPLSLKEGGHVTALENLQTLSIGRDFDCIPEILEMVPNLKKLGIFYTRLEDTYHLRNVAYLQQLESLKLEMQEFPCFNLAFPSTLKKLSLSGARLPWHYMKVVGLLPNLEVLKLRKGACVGKRWQTTEGEFCQLKFLMIGKSDLQDWVTESTHFPKLKCLVLYKCHLLSEIPDGIRENSTLEEIKLYEVQKSLLDSAEQMKDDQQNEGNFALQITHIPDYVEVTIDITDDEVRVLNVKHPFK